MPVAQDKPTLSTTDAVITSWPFVETYLVVLVGRTLFHVLTDLRFAPRHRYVVDDCTVKCDS